MAEAQDVFSKEDYESLDRAIHAGKVNPIGFLNEIHELRTEKATAVREAYAKGVCEGQGGAMTVGEAKGRRDMANKCIKALKLYIATGNRIGEFAVTLCELRDEVKG